ncbi:MAG: hypothetical protein HY665_06635 [Chloroflexi bacterium]|nr:hypothetical protein [Chloroflexota bacterium]
MTFVTFLDVRSAPTAWRKGLKRAETVVVDFELLLILFQFRQTICENGEKVNRDVDTILGAKLLLIGQQRKDIISREYPVRTLEWRNHQEQDTSQWRCIDKMVTFSRQFTFDLPYDIRITDGQVTKDIVMPLSNMTGRIIIHPPRAHEKRYIYKSPEKAIWVADRIKIDVQIESDTSISSDDLETISEDTAQEYVMRFLRYCRHASKQPQIDLKQGLALHVTYIDESGQQVKEGYVSLSLRLGGRTSLDDQSWNTVFQCMLKNTRIPFYEEALLDAKLYQSYNDYRMASVNAAMGVEAVVNSYLRKTLRQKLVDTHRGTVNQIDKFIDEISIRQLIPVGLGLTSMVDQQILVECRKTMQLRNDIVHGKRRLVSSDEAGRAIWGLEQLMSAKDILDVLGEVERANEESEAAN